MNDATTLKNATLPPLPGAVHEGRANADASLSVTLVLQPPQSWHSHMREGLPGPHAPQRFVDYRRFAATLGSPAEDIAIVEACLRKQGLQVGKASPALHLVRASGTDDGDVLG